MKNRFLALSLMGALALSSLPAFAEDATFSESDSSVSSSSASSESMSAVSTSSQASARNLGQRIKDKCHKLSGKSRVLCMSGEKLSDRKLPPKMVMKKVMKKAVKKNCHDYTKNSPEFKTCVGEQKKIVKEQHPKAAKAIMKMHENKKGMKGSSSSAS